MSEGENEVHESSDSVWRDLNLPELDEAQDVAPLVQHLREGAVDLTPYCADAAKEPMINCALPAFLADAADLLEEIDAACLRVRGVGIPDAIRDYIEDARRLHAEKMDWRERATKAEAALREKAMEYLALDQQATEALARAVKAEEEASALRRLLSRYRKETPLGHQPHMIAAEVDATLVAKEESNA